MPQKVLALKLELIVENLLWLLLKPVTNDTYLMTVDHHIGSEEHQPGEIFDKNFYDERLHKFNIILFLDLTLRIFLTKNLLPAVGDSK